MESESLTAESTSPLSLQDICLNAVSLSLSNILKKQLMMVRPITLESSIVVEIIKKAQAISPVAVNDVLLLEEICPTFSNDEDFDNFFWKGEVEKRFSVRKIPSPFKELTEKVSTLREHLDNFKSLSTYDLKTELHNLTKIPFSIELFHQTKLGVTVNNIRKSSTDKINELCTQLLSKWKTLKQYWNHEKESEDSKSESGINESIIEDINIGKISTQINTWKELYMECLDLETIKFENCATKIRSQVTTMKDTRRSTKQIDFKSTPNPNFKHTDDSKRSVRAIYGHAKSSSSLMKFTTARVITPQMKLGKQTIPLNSLSNDNQTKRKASILASHQSFLPMKKNKL
mmetsp:Transcript_29212/g.29572  ORF Transcript_29212/g.29572 Transcript_29212/m.29572 type:complete len:345 (+) Transcript_29212:95-1129(+)